ncbi:MAG TPA: ATP-binding cassette domain-containing protein [Micromonosporaceae bacterium]|jgi:ABC-2 type transport system ATP-binding protein
MAAELAIETQGLRKSYKDHQVLTGVDLAVARGTVHALLGPNGAGKTTLVRILATLVAADGGSARVAGFDIVKQRRQVRRHISLTGQYAAVDEVQTGAENLRMMGRLVGLSGRAARTRADEMLARFDLTDAAGRRVGEYSGGMRRRLDLAASLVGGPEVVFLDEPSTGLDLPSRQAMWQIVSELVGTGVTVFLTTQYLEEADVLADRVAVINHGRIIADDTASALKNQVAEQRLDVTADSVDAFQRVSEMLAGRIVHRDAAKLTVGVATDGSAGHVRGVLDMVDPSRRDVAAFAVHAATLDDVFLALTGQPAAIEEKETINV